MILLVGATGNVGGEAFRQLTAAGRPVRAMVRDESKSAELRKAGAETFVADLDAPDTLAAAIDGVEGVLVSTSINPSITQQHINLIEAARKAGVMKFVRISSAKADEEGYQYAKWHKPADDALRNSGMSYTIVRPAGFMQNFLMNAGSIQSDSAFYSSAGDGKVSFIDVRDIGQLAAQVLTEAAHENTVYELTGPAPVSHYEIAEAIGKAIGKDIRYIPVTDEQAKGAFLGWGLPEWFADSLIDLNRYYRGNNMDHVSDDFKKVTGHQPRSIEQFANDYAAAFKG